jgi:hypothetical protein
MRKPILAALLAMLPPLALAVEPPPVPYPDGYRDWRHVKSMMIEKGHPLYESFGGIHHIYANSKALEGYRTGRFPDGAVLIFDLFEAQAADHAVTEGQRKVLGVMHKDSRKYAATGGWGYEGFAGGDRNTRAVGKNAATACHACHAQQKDRDYVFSAPRD